MDHELPSNMHACRRRTAQEMRFLGNMLSIQPKNLLMVALPHTLRRRHCPSCHAVAQPSEGHPIVVKFCGSGPYIRGCVDLY